MHDTVRHENHFPHIFCDCIEIMTPLNGFFLSGSNNRGNGFPTTGNHQFVSGSPLAAQNNVQPVTGNNQQRSIQQNQKTRKPFFMPYMSIDAVNRGLANGDLIKVFEIFLLLVE